MKRHLFAGALATIFAFVTAFVAPGGPTAAIAWSTTPRPCSVADVLTPHRAYRDWKITLLDTYYRLPSKYYPGDLRATGVSGGGQVRGFVVADLRALAAAAKKAGAPVAIQSSFRSYSTQASTFSYWVRKAGYAAALRTSARAGHSEHQLGTTIDFRSYGGAAPWTYADWATTKAGAWMKRNAWKYGFIMSYPKGRAAKSCYSYEPWHYRYVGRDQAKVMHDAGLVPRYWLWRVQ